VVVNYVTNSVSVLLGNGDGTFQSPVDYNVGSFPRFVVVSDFNLDGNLDLAVSNSEDTTVSILLGNGDGTFQLARNFEAGHGADRLAVGDFNQDGYPDLVVTHGYTDYFSVLLNAADWGQRPAGASRAQESFSPQRGGSLPGFLNPFILTSLTKYGLPADSSSRLTFSTGPLPVDFRNAAGLNSFFGGGYRDDQVITFPRLTPENTALGFNDVLGEAVFSGLAQG
jgi:hypothetical protein